MLLYKDGDLFEGFAADESEHKLIAHACNCMGTWGPIIAAEFKRRFPTSFLEYKEVCDGGILPGEVLKTSENVLCLFTSKGYSKRKDQENVIISNTTRCITNLDLLFRNGMSYKIHSPLINAGQFAVPWERTEHVINVGLRYLEKCGIQVDWTVWRKR